MARRKTLWVELDVSVSEQSSRSSSALSEVLQFLVEEVPRIVVLTDGMDNPQLNLEG